MKIIFTALVGLAILASVAAGYESIAESVDVEAGPRDLKFNFKDVKLNASKF